MGPGRSSLTRALEELTSLLPKALDSCAAASQPDSQSSPVVVKLRSVLLELLTGCLTCNTGKHVVAVLRILKLVLERLPAAFTAGALHQATVQLTHLINRLPTYQGAIDDQLLAVWCCVTSLLADKDPHLLRELHADTVDLVLGLQEVLTEMASAYDVQQHSMQLLLFPGLLADMQAAATAAQPASEGPSQDAQQQGQAAIDAVQIELKKPEHWQAYCTFAVRLLSHQLEQFPTLLGPCVPGTVAMALADLLAFRSTTLQESCMHAMALVTLHHQQDAGLCATVLQHVLWLMDCITAGHIGPDAVSVAWQGAAIACLHTCTSALQDIGLMEMYGHRLVNVLSLFASMQQPYCIDQALWLGLLHDLLLHNPQQASVAALWLPLTTGPDATAAAQQALQEVWQLVGRWTGAADIKRTWALQFLQRCPDLHPESGSNVTDVPGDPSASPAKKKQRKLKQAQLTVTDTGYLCSQRPGKSSQGSDPAPPPPAATPPAAAILALETVQQLMQLQPMVPAAAAAARIAAIVMSLGPTSEIPPVVAAGLDILAHTSEADANTDASCEDADTTSTKAAALNKLKLLQLLLTGLLSGGYQASGLVACVASQVVGWMQHSTSQPEQLQDLLPPVLLALAASASTIAQEPDKREEHVRVWQPAHKLMQGPTSLFATGLTGPPCPLTAAITTAWLLFTKLSGDRASTAYTAAAAQVQAGLQSDSAEFATVSAQLLPLLCVLQHAAPQQGSNQQQGVLLVHGYQPVIASCMQALQSIKCADAPAVGMSAVKSLSVLLQASIDGLQPSMLAEWLQAGADCLLHSCTRASFTQGVGTPKRAGTESQSAALQLPPLCDLFPVLQPVLSQSDGSTSLNSSSKLPAVAVELQVAALQLLGMYLAAAAELSDPATVLAGSRLVLVQALDLITSPHNPVRDAALSLIHHYLTSWVLQEAFGRDQASAAQPARAAGKQATAGQRDAAALLNGTFTTPKLPHWQLLEHLQGLLSSKSNAASAGANQAAAVAATGGAESTVAAKVAVMRAFAGLYEGLLGSDSEELPLLFLLEQVACEHAQVSACALELLQHLAVRHTSSKDLEELLLEGTTGTAVLTHVGKKLQDEPQLLGQMASLLRVHEGQLAAAVAPHVVPWMCQEQLKGPLELLASKLGQAPSALMLSSADQVLAHMLWFKADKLAGFIEWVDDIMQPESFVTVIRVMGRKVARRIIYQAGQTCFWRQQYHAPADLLNRAEEYVGIVANGMSMQGQQGILDLLQGETIALLLKDIGNTLSKPLDSDKSAAKAPAQRVGATVTSHAASISPSQLSGIAADKLQCLRTLVVLMHMLRQQLGTHALQMMAVLSEALLHCAEGQLLMQALAAWLSFVQLLARLAPQVLQRVAAQAAVVLLPVLEPANDDAAPATSKAGSYSTTKAATAATAATTNSEVDAAAQQLAAAILHEIVVMQRQHVRPALLHMPPLPPLDVLKDVNAVLAQEQHRHGPLQHLQLLINALRHESVSVRHVGLGELRSFLMKHKTFMADAMAGLLSCSGTSSNGGAGATVNGKGLPAAAAAQTGSANQKLASAQCQNLFNGLLSALLASCDSLPRSKLAQSMKQRCAQCLGLLGAIDPALVQPELPRPAPFAYQASSFLVSLVQQQLVRVLQTACDIQQLEATSYAIQHILQHYTKRRLESAQATMEAACAVGASAAEVPKDAEDQGDPAGSGSLYSMLDDSTKSIVMPFLTTRFIVPQKRPEEAGVIFGSHPHTFRRWLHLWLKQLSWHTSGPLSVAFDACRGVATWDQPLMLFLLPFVLAEVAGQGGKGLDMLVNELTAIMQCAAAGPESHIPDMELYVHCTFTQLDLLKQWMQEQQELADKAAEAATTRQTIGAGNRSGLTSSPEPQLSVFAANVQQLVSAIPIQTMAQAALRCGSYARALQYFETHVRDVHGGGLNPAAFNGGCSSYSYDEVSFLLEVYGQLEEPDGLAGLVQLRQGGLTTADQILAAEKAGAWSEALALYEQALSQEATAATAGNTTGGANVAGSITAPCAAAGDVLMVAARAVAAGTAASTDQNGQQQHMLVQTIGGIITIPLLAQLPSTFAAAAISDAGAQTAGGAAALAAHLSSLQVGQLRCLLQMGHYQTLLRQIDGLLARCLGSGAQQNLDPAQGTQAGTGPAHASQGLAALQWSVTQLAALGVAAAWRLGSWALLRGHLSVVDAAFAAGGKPLCPADQWEVCVGFILDAAQKGSHDEVLTGLHNARAGVLGLLPAIAGESYTRAYPDLLKLHMLQEVEGVSHMLQQAQPVGAIQRGRLLRWSDRLSLTAPLLSCRGPLLALRRQLAALLQDKEGTGRAWLQHAKLCRLTGHHEAAETSVLEALARGVPGALLERCRLLWEQDKGHRAVMELQQLVQQCLEQDAAPTDAAVQHQRAKEMLQLTEWMAAVGQGGREILCDNYEDAIRMDPNWEKAHFAYACYLDQLYKDAKQREGKTVKHGNDRLGGRSRIRTAEEHPFDYLPQALQHYGESIRAGHKHILQSLPRLLTLYFEFGSKVAAAKTTTQKIRNAQTQVNGVMGALVRSIPTYKWLLVLPQLTSRMCHAHPDVQEFMQQVLGNIMDHFPQQALWAMAMVSKSTIRNRQEAASSILRAAKGRSNEAGQRLFSTFARFVDQLINTCMWQPAGDRRLNRCSANKEFRGLIKLLPVDIQVPVQALFTVDLPSGGKLPPGHRPVSSQACITELKDEVLIMSSLMKPKKLTFIGSDGVEYPFLAKPKDDLRKDYRLMDFAGTLNALLAWQPQARRRGLSLRTYAVLPLTDDCGILQWVNNLVPFKVACEEIYIKEKLYKRSSTPMQIKKMYDNFKGARRCELLDQVLSMLPPRMSKWLLGRFADPGTWLEARLAFTRTNAAWAMVGHMLGLGDRHGENIMISGLTGETMHVDFGCLFDRGLTLEVPEMVPFRLTQNVVDCFGVSGVEGTYRRAAEMTLQVLRDNKATLMTCAETFLHDPLVDWTKAGKSSSNSAVEADNPQAKDALAVMEGRLSGTLLGVASIPTLPLSCEGQAARLISEASDHENLGRMYIWWMPWM